ncbi:xylulokinase [Aureimonas endophytica]|uniref:Xylulose kinase n=1 Tax=Aureimonas endophytica TaxID=2027858 RepID=A0A916ZII3_9HYPH|nr:xylulokinase [Aureimonas endophytica]GGD98571.1 xylulokinase [Aureimonas endophytica]
MFLGIDIGTTATKAALFDASFARVAAATSVYEVDQPRPGVSEIDPGLWLAACRETLAAIRAAAPAAFAATRAIGLSGQMHSIVTLDAGDRLLRPAILWNDARGVEEAAHLAQALPAIGTETGVLPMPSFSAAKLLWLARHAPEDMRRLARVGFAKDYVRHWLTGEWATDVSDAAGGQLLDEAARDWSDAVLGAIGLDRAVLPRLLEGPAPAGRLRGALAAELGLPAGIPVATGGGDAATGALGLGCVSAGDSFVSLGTGTILVSVQERYRPEPASLLHTFAHCVPGRWYQMAAMLNGASCLAWAARLCGEPSVEGLLGRAEALGPGPGRVLFQPYLRGERTPHNDVEARGAFLNLEAGTEAPDLARAVLEGVAFSLRQGRDLMRAAGTATGAIRLIGGGARSAYWRRVIATVLDEPLHLVADADFAGASGAARLGAMAAGEAPARCMDAPPVAAVDEPDPMTAAAYAERYALWRELYPALRRFQ